MTSKPPRQRGDPASNGEGRLPPHNLEAEASLLGAAMLDGDAVRILVGTTRVDDFYKPTHQHIAAGIHSMADRHADVDPVTLAEELRRDGLLETIGGPQYLNELVGATPAVSNASSYARIIATTAAGRRLIGSHDDFAAIGYGSSADTAEMMARAQDVLDRIAQSAAPRRSPTSWRPIDLSDAVNGADVPAPVLMPRSDGVNLLYAGRTHGFAGESEACKSWGALTVAAKLIADSDVLWIDFEDDDRGTVARLRSLMVPADQIVAHFVYVRPDEPLSAKGGAITFAAVDFDELLTSRSWALIVIDGVTVSMSAEGMDINSNLDVARWSAMLPRRCADTGAPTVVIDHVTKSADGRGRYAIGGQHKLAAITGAQYLFEVEVPFGRSTVDERTGIMRVTVTKDRPGHVRSYAVDGVIARLNLTSYPDGGVTAVLVAPDGSQIDLKLAGEIAKHLSIYPASSKNSIEGAVDAKALRLRKTLTMMVESGWVTVEKKGQSHLHSLTDAGAEYFE